MTLTWATHEDHLSRLAETDTAQGDGRFIPTLLVFDGDDIEIMIRARTSRPRDERDPLSELATYVAARCPTQVALAIPGRLYELTGWTQTDLLATAVISSSAVFHDGRFEHRTRMLSTSGHANSRQRADLETELSPVASLLDDALRFPSPVDARQTLSVLVAWGHTAAVPSSRVGAAATRGTLAPSSGDRHRVHRLAVEFGRRHTPVASVSEARRRPAIFTDVPSGWQAACPL